MFWLRLCVNPVFSIHAYITSLTSLLPPTYSCVLWLIYKTLIHVCIWTSRISTLKLCLLDFKSLWTFIICIPCSVFQETLILSDCQGSSLVWPCQSKLGIILCHKDHSGGVSCPGMDRITVRVCPLWHPHCPFKSTLSELNLWSEVTSSSQSHLPHLYHLTDPISWSSPDVRS